VLFYRDQTIEQLVTEDATQTLVYYTEPDRAWKIYTQHKPIIIPESNGKFTNSVKDVIIEIDNGDGIFLEVPAFSVKGNLGEIDLISSPTYNSVLEQIIPARLPYPPNGRVKVTYKYLKNQVLSRLQQRIYYKATTVAVDPKDKSKIIETPIDEVEYRSTFDMEEIDYIWKEAIRRNRWILEQGGERVMVFIRSSMGEQCPCFEDSHGQPLNDCPQCLGTGYIPPYSGPYNVIIAPPEAQKSIELLDMGLRINYEYESFTGPFPTLRERDVIVRPNNERYVVGPVNYQGSRGATYQQHFTMAYLDELDIRYKIGVPGGETEVPADWDQYYEAQPSPASPIRPVNPRVDISKQVRGRTVSFQNINY
jgi:hypothetical protein